MKFRIPFTIASVDKLKKRSAWMKKRFHRKKNSKLEKYLEGADIELSREEYLSICVQGFFSSLLVFLLISSTVLFFLEVGNFIFISLGFSLAFSGFIFFARRSYPKVYNSRKQREIETNLIPALQDMLVQLNSGVPLFSILVNLSSSDYGALSEEFKKTVRKINAGLPEVDVLEELGESNPSLFFRRALWQISNGMRSGGDISVIIRESINSLNEEQLVQIQNYGNKLNPAIMFYMLTSVILPALAITFLTIISSLVNLPTSITTLMFIGLFVFVMIIQVVFLGVIRSIRPSLL